jgi:hypothetical protein
METYSQNDKKDENVEFRFAEKLMRNIDSKDIKYVDIPKEAEVKLNDAALEGYSQVSRRMGSKGDVSEL